MDGIFNAVGRKLNGLGIVLPSKLGQVEKNNTHPANSSASEVTRRAALQTMAAGVAAMPTVLNSDQGVLGPDFNFGSDSTNQTLADSLDDDLDCFIGGVWDISEDGIN